MATDGGEEPKLGRDLSPEEVSAFREKYNQKGWAPVKMDYIVIHKKRTAETQGTAEAGAAANSDDGPPPSKRAKLKGRNKKRPGPTRPVYDSNLPQLCSHAIASPDASCPFTTACRYSHDLKAYKLARPPDLGSECPTFVARGRCSMGVTCRYGASHIDAEGRNVVDEARWTEYQQTKNRLNSQIQADLWKRKYDFSKSFDTLTRLGIYISGLKQQEDKGKTGKSTPADGLDLTSKSSAGNGIAADEKAEVCADSAGNGVGAGEKAEVCADSAGDGVGADVKAEVCADSAGDGVGVGEKAEVCADSAGDGVGAGEKAEVCADSAGDAVGAGEKAEVCADSAGDAVGAGEKVEVCVDSAGDAVGAGEKVEVCADSAGDGVGAGEKAEVCADSAGDGVGVGESAKVEAEELNGNCSTERMDHGGDDSKVKLRPTEKKKIDFSNLSYLAPLTTVGNLPFRRVCKEFGVDVTCGEMAMARNLLMGKKTEWALLMRHPSENLFGVQLCGGYPDRMTKCAQMVSEQCEIDFIDINCGCPIDLVYQRGEGSGLMRHQRRLEDCVRSMSAVVDCPITVKMRTGIYKDKNTAHTLLPRLRDCGAAMATVHGRSREQRYTKEADWEYIRECVEIARPMPLFGNGDVLSWEDAVRCQEASGVSGIMLGRGALIKPWLFTEIRERRHWDISATERFDILRRYSNYGLEHWGSDARGVEITRRFMLEWLSFLHRYIPVGLLERLPQRINDRPPQFVGRSDLETLLSSNNCSDWVKISEMLLGPVPDNFVFLPKHKANSYQA